MKLFISGILLVLSFVAIAQEETSEFPSDTSKKYVLKKIGKTLGQSFGLKTFTPEERPKIALVRSILPGWGQYTNKDYWKLPLVYGAAGAGIFGIRANQKSFLAYRLALEKVVAYERASVFLNQNAISGEDIYLTVLNETNAFDINQSEVYILDNEIYYTLSPRTVKSDKNAVREFDAIAQESVNPNLIRGPLNQDRITAGTKQFRRYRDLSRIGFAAGWLLLAVEANVAGHMKTFDTSDDISYKFSPTIINTPIGAFSGVALTLNF